MLKKIIKQYILDPFLGKKMFQPFFERVHFIALQGMNFYGVSIGDGGEKMVINRFFDQLDKNINPIIFDVGANIGDYSMAVNSIFKERAQLYCFEPSKETFVILEENLKNHKNIKLYNFGFGEDNKQTVLYSDKKGSGLASLYDRKLEYHGITMDQRENVTIKRLDDFCRENNIEHINFLKMDVEGNELNILKGAEKMIKLGTVDFIQFEFGGCNIDSRTFFKDFFDFLNPNYKIYRILKDGIRLVDTYKEEHEVFLTINYLAISRNYMQNI
ncbi:MAG: hypothetical protein A2904_01460 [Candidatus Staskawiczbacteria bacterium RIFCSPLOWO2_01_FULL_33_9]|uniref:Methyltransferase FkbM domain-containing protein n=1 Tax=Candidatus Staskawiczbacteria bacterium RIFCSPLOWO2_01_FULL_33_9 TaxID=1802211 RepID=A0A1G2I916_9BACT|nr:MAG: hypothetical protein A2904_01460 [Candidatus Staskawiczbacteria bacterium RIFCSPLOWO2_01_FULL_33_9]